MYRVLVVGDPHFKVSNLSVMRKFIKKMKILAQQKDFDFMVCLGDTIHSHNKIDQSCLKLAIYFFREISNFMPVYVLIGNHDRPRETIYLTDDHPFHGLNDNEKIKVVWKPIDFQSSKGRVVFVPYVSPGRFQEALNTLTPKIEKDKPVVIFAHQEFRGSKNEQGIISTKGDMWDISNPLVISGHIHEYQILQKNIIYVGTPVQHTFSESTLKAVGVFKFGKTGYSGIRMKLGLRKKETIETDIDNIPKNINSDENVEYRLIIKCKHSEMKSFEKSDTYKILIKNNVKVHYSFVSDIKINTDKNCSWLDLMKEKCNDEQMKILSEII